MYFGIIDTERPRISLETVAIRTRGWIRLSLSLAGIALVLVGAWNLLLAPTLGTNPFLSEYRRFLLVLVVSDGGILHLADIVLVGVGAVVAWFS